MARNNRRKNYKKEPVLRPLEVEVRNGDVDFAYKILKNKINKDGVLGELKRRRAAEKPSEKKRRKKREMLRKIRRRMKNRMKRNSKNNYRRKK